jgi:hypothetical protein
VNDVRGQFDALLVMSSLTAFILAVAVVVLAIVAVYRMERGTDSRGFVALVVACGLGAVALGVVAYESEHWARAFAVCASAAAASCGSLVTTTNAAMRPFATAAILLAMAIPVALVPATNRARIAIGLVVLVVGGFAVGVSAAAYEGRMRVESAGVVSAR